MAFNAQLDEKPPLSRRALSLALSIVIYPITVSATYRKYIGSVKEMAQMTSKEDPHLLKLASRLNSLVMYLIKIPLIAGVIASLYLITSDSVGMSRFRSAYYGKPYGKVLQNKVKYSKWTINLIRSVPLSLNKLRPLAFMEIAAIVGAGFLMLNPAFKRKKQLQEIFIKKRHLDVNEYPWDVVYTPTAILVRGWGANVADVATNPSIWSTVNFQAGHYVISKKDQSVFMVLEKQDLPSSLVFDTIPTKGIKQEESK